MYTVTATVEGKTLCLHDDTVEDKRVKLLEPTLELEKNTAGKFTFKLAPTNQGYSEYTFTTKVITKVVDGVPQTRDITTTLDMVARMRSTIRVYRDGVELWEGRVLSEEKDWWNLRSITCEGELAYLNDSCQSLKRYSDCTLSQFLDEILKVHNSKVEADKRFVKGTVTVASAAQSIGWRDTKYESTMETVNKLITDFGGIIRVRKVSSGGTTTRLLDWLEDYPNVSNQTINFGKNLLDFKCTWDLSKLCTVLLPTGKVIEEAGQDQVGDQIEWTTPGLRPDPHRVQEGKLLEVDEETGKVKITDVPTLPGYKLGICNITASAEDPTYIYLSSRLHDGFVCYAAFDDVGGTGNELTHLTSTQDSGYEFKDLIDQKIELPSGTKSIMVCSFGDDIPIAVKECEKAKRTIVSGTELTPSATDTQAVLYYDTEDEHNTVELIEAPDGYHVAYYDSAHGLPVSTAGDLKKVYISCRLNGSYTTGSGDEAVTTTNLVTWVAKTEDGGMGSQLMYNIANPQSKEYFFEDFINHEVTLPAGTHSLIVCSYGDGIPIKVRTSLTEEIDESKAPLGAYLTVEECPNDPGWHTKGSLYVEYQEMVKKYGWIEKQINLDEVEDQDTLYSTAKRYLQESMFDEMEIEVSAVDLKSLGVNVDHINFLDKVMVKSEPHGLDKMFPVDKVSIPLLELENQKFTLGTNSTNSLTDANTEFNEDVIRKISVTSSETLNNAKKDAANLIAMATNGHISIIKDENGCPKEFVISDTADPNDCTSCWIWNVNGLGHFDHYPLVPGELFTNVALTMDGSIVADRITTGVMTAILLRGCRAIFGGMDSEDGTVLVKSGNPGVDSDTFCVEMRHGGIHFGNLTAVTDASAGLHVQSNTSGSYTLSEFAKIQSDKTYQSDVFGATPGLVVDSKILALDIDELWVSTKSSYNGGGNDAVGGATGPNNEDIGPYWMMTDDGNGNPSGTYEGPYFVRHGILIGDYRTTNNRSRKAVGGNEEKK